MWSAYPDLAAVLRRCEGASGLASIKPGFAITPEYDRLFALGFPHLRLLVSGCMDDRAPQLHARKAAHQYDPFYRVAWPEKVAHRYVRALGTRTLDLGRGARLSRHAVEAVATSAPLEVRSARALVGRVMRGLESRQSWKLEDFVFLL